MSISGQCHPRFNDINDTIDQNFLTQESVRTAVF